MIIEIQCCCTMLNLFFDMCEYMLYNIRRGTKIKAYIQ